MKLVQSLVGLLLFSSITCYAQSAKVIALSESDASSIASLYKQKQDIQNKIDKLKIEIGNKYTKTDDYYSSTGCFSVNGSGQLSLTTCEQPKLTQGQEEQNKVYIPKVGWENGFEFSEDFKFIVPITLNYTSTYNNTCISNPNNWTTAGGLISGFSQ
jgi:hypothetical protein